MDHDGIYKLLFSEPAMVADLLRGFVKEPCVEEVDLPDLEEVNPRHVSSDLDRRENDMICRIGLREGDSLYVYLMLEFQSTVGWNMALRMLDHVTRFYSWLARTGAEMRKPGLRQVVPVVLYNGKKRWTATLNVSELIEERLPG